MPIMRLFAWFGLVAFLGGCAIGDYVEAVFLQQHNVLYALTQIIDTAETDAPELAENLYVTEASINQACAPIQQLAAIKMRGDRIDFAHKFSAYNASAECERKSSEVELILWRIDPETAESFLSESKVLSREENKANERALEIRSRAARGNQSQGGEKL